MLVSTLPVQASSTPPTATDRALARVQDGQGSEELFESPDDLCSLEVLFNGKREIIGEISRRNIHVIEADKRFVILGKPVNLGYGAGKDRFCAAFGTEGD